MTDHDRCRMLRGRSSYGPTGLDADAAGSPLEGYWCVATMEPVGPDDGLAEPQRCGPWRACFAGRGLPAGAG